MTPLTAVAGTSNGSAAPSPDAPRPILRGALHFATALLLPAGLVLLLLIADSPRRYTGAAIFGASITLLYASSASYHLVPWPPRLRRIMKRVDHSMVFVLIAGTYTPFCLVVLDATWGVPILAVVWSLAAAGIVMKMLRPDDWRALSVALYVGLGWLALVAAPPLVSSLSVPAIALLAGGGLSYTIGALVYARRRPDPFPRVFGFHEIFHVFVVAGSALHFAALAVYVLPS